MKYALLKRYIKSQIDKYDIISFDIFDTLIKRNVQKPTDIFYITENRYNNLFENKISNFHDDRILAEKNARNKTEKEEINLLDVYKELKYDDKTKENLLKLEIETEIDYSCKNKFMYEIYKYCIEKKKKIICISDMYLDEKNIMEILNKNGYNIKNIYVSSKYNCTKKTGNLFKYVTNELKIKYNQLLHIGDNKKSDFIIPIKLGIKSIKIKCRVNNINGYIETKYDNRKKGELSNNIIFSVINNNINNYDNEYQKFGFEVIGPIIMEFTKWVHDEAKRKGIKSLLFCARDMKIVQATFEDYYGQGDIKNIYFYVSRRSTFLPYLYSDNTFENLIKIAKPQFKGKNKYSIRDFYSAFNIEFGQKNNIDIDKKMKFGELINSKDIKKIYYDYAKTYVEKYGKKQYELLSKYFYKNYIENKTALVDIGWSGTTQSILMQLTKKDIFGYYYGIFKENNEMKNNYSTFWTNPSMNNNCELKKLSISFKAFFELMISATHGTTLKYKGSQDINNCYILDKGINENNEEIKNIQIGAKCFCKDFIKYIGDISLENNRYWTDRLLNICVSPSNRQVKKLGNIKTDYLKDSKLVNYKGIKYYLFHPGQIAVDFHESEWKIGFLRRIIKIKLPYKKIYMILKK